MKRALVLGGGGSKGAYEMGVWTALNELDIKIDLVCGTSIGALIGAMYVQNDYEKAKWLWDDLCAEDIMKDGFDFEFDIDILKKSEDKTEKFVSNFIENKGADISPFIEMINKMFDEKKFFSSPIDFACMTVKMVGLQPVPVYKCEMTSENAKDYLLASASCFPAFPLKEIDNEYFIDGGYYDNVPVELAIQMGANEIIAVDLKSIGFKQPFQSHDHLIYIEPYVPLGSFLNFNQITIQRNMRLGYFDTMKAFHKYLGYAYTFEYESKDDIEQNELFCKQYLKNKKDDVSKSRLWKYLIEKEYEELKEYRYPYTYLRILEICAETVEIPYDSIYQFSKFQKIVYEQFIHKTIDIPVMELENAMEYMKHIANDPKLNMIHFIYQYLLKNVTLDSKLLQSLSLTSSTEFLCAICFVLLHEKFN